MKSRYVTTGLTVLAGLLFSSSVATGGGMYSTTKKEKPISAEEAQKNCLALEGVFLENNYVATCVTQDGTFGARDEMLGMAFNPEGTGTVAKPDYLRPGKAFEFFSVSFNGENFHNTNAGEEEIPTGVKPLSRLSSDEQNGGAMAYSTIRGHDGSRLQIIQKYTVDPNAREIVVRVEMKNMGISTIRNLYYARGIDPNQDVDSFGLYETLNHRGGSFGGLETDEENIAHATGAKGDLALALYSVDINAHNTCITSEKITDAEAIYNREAMCGEKKTAYLDATINLGFRLGDLRSRQTKVFSFKYLFNVVKPAPQNKDAFIIEVKTDNEGVSADNEFTIPVNPEGYSYNYNIDCDSDGVNEAEGVNSDYTCEYSTPGVYTVSIRDNTGEGTGFPAVNFWRNAPTDNLKLINIKQWGTGKWKTMKRAFAKCKNMDSDATDIPDLSLVTDMSAMFYAAVLFDADISRWDVSSVTSMNGLFSGARLFNADISRWDVSGVINMSSMFHGAMLFNADISRWDTSSAKRMDNMFNGAKSFNQPIGNWGERVSGVQNMRMMFAGASNFNRILAKWNVSSVTHMQGMFFTAIAFDQDLSGWDVSNVKYMHKMFTGSHLSNSNYNNLLIGWSELTLQNNVKFHAGEAHASGDGAAAKENIVTSFHWDITDGDD